MTFNNPLPRATQPTFHEGSGLRSPRDADAVARQWGRNKQVGRQNDAVNRAVTNLQRTVDKIKRRIPGGYRAPAPVTNLFQCYQIAPGVVGLKNPGSLLIPGIDQGPTGGVTYWTLPAVNKAYVLYYMTAAPPSAAYPELAVPCGVLLFNFTDKIFYSQPNYGPGPVNLITGDSPDFTAAWLGLIGGNGDGVSPFIQLASVVYNAAGTTIVQNFDIDPGQWLNFFSNGGFGLGWGVPGNPNGGISGANTPLGNFRGIYSDTAVYLPGDEVLLAGSWTVTVGTQTSTVNVRCTYICELADVSGALDPAFAYGNNAIIPGAITGIAPSVTAIDPTAGHPWRMIGSVITDWA